MADSPISLGAVHFAQSDLSEFEEHLHGLARDPEMEIQIKSNGFPVTAPSVSKLLSRDTIEDESLAYRIHLSATEGELFVVADSKAGDEHLLHIDGFDEWEEFVSEEIGDFLDGHKITWRSYLPEKVIFWTEVASAIVLSLYLTYFLPGKILQYVPTVTDAAITIISLGVLLITAKRNWVYPYFSVSLDGKNRYPRIGILAFPLIALTGFILGVL